MKLLVVGDPHFDPTGPTTRIDDYGQTCIDKISEVFSIATMTGAELIVILGDTFERTIESPAYRSLLKKALKKSPVPLMSLIGNHLGDTVHKKFHSWTEREFGDFVASEALYPLVDPFLIDNQTQALPINAYQYTKETLPEDNPECPVRVIFSHTYIDTSLDDELAFSSAFLKNRYPHLQAIFAGHDHQHYNPTVVGGLGIFRPGSLLRTSSDISSFRVPCVAFYDTEDPSSYFEHAITCALPYERIFSVDAKVFDKEAKNQFLSFQESIKLLRKEESGVMELVWNLADQVIDQTRFRYISEDLTQHGFIRGAKKTEGPTTGLFTGGEF